MSTIANKQMICDVLLEQGKTNKDIVVLCSDSRGSASMGTFADALPQQFVEVGIAEQNIVSIGAGLASAGKRAFCVSPASFLSTRSYEQIKVDVAYSNFPVVLVGISGGVSYGALGGTHHSLQDIAALAPLPNLEVHLPSDRFRTAVLFRQLLHTDTPAYVRVGRNPVPDIYTEDTVPNHTNPHVLTTGDDLTIFATGESVYHAWQAALSLEQQGLGVTMVDICQVSPLATDTVLELSQKAKAVLTVEEHSYGGGLGSMVAQILGEHAPKKIRSLAFPHEFVISGTSAQLFAHYGLDQQGIVSAAKELFV